MHHHYIDRFSDNISIVHSVDPRIKTICAVFFTLLIVSVNKYYILPLLPFFIIPIGIFIVGKIPILFSFKRLLALSPFILTLAILNPIYNTVPVKLNGLFFSYEISLGWLNSINICLKFSLSVLMITALSSTTRFSDFIHGLAWFKFPKILLLQINLLYRYLFVVIEQIQKLLLAKQLRMFGKLSFISKSKIYGSMISILFVRSLNRAERVHLAMWARGFNGDLISSKKLNINRNDILYLLIFSGICFLCAIPLFL